MVREAFVYALDWAMLVCLLVSVAGVLASFLVPEALPGRSTRLGTEGTNEGLQKKRKA